MITKWLIKKYENLDVIDDDLQYKIFGICATIIITIAILLDVFLIIPEIIYCLLKTLFIIIKGNKDE
jgi:hypothetical protein